MNYYIPVFATEVEESKTLVIHGIPNQRFGNKEAAEKHFSIKPWGSIDDYRRAKKNGWKIQFLYPTN